MTKKSRIRIDTSMPFDEPESGHVREHLWSRTLSVISTVASAGRDFVLKKSVSFFRPKKHGAQSLYKIILFAALVEAARFSGGQLFVLSCWTSSAKL